MSHRRQQLESSIRRAVGEILAEGLADPRIRGLITVTGVTVSEDRRHATVAVSVLPEDREELTLHGLRSAAGRIQSQVAGRVRARALPDLRFHLDRTLKTQAAVLGAIREATADLADGGDAPGPAETGHGPGENRP